MSDSVTDQAVHEHWMRQALIGAQKAGELDEVPVGAVVVHEGEIIGRGWNKPISGCDPTAHAEVMALREAAASVENYRLVDCDLYVTIEPCTMCAGAIVHSRIRRVIYGAVEPKAGCVESNGNLFQAPYFNHRVEALGGVLGQECSQIISDFFARRRAEKKAEKRLKSQDAKC